MKSGAISVGYWLVEVALVTIGLLIVTVISQVLFGVLISVIGKSVTARDSLMTIIEALSFVMAAVACIITGVVVGLFANRRTMIGSLIGANILVTIALQSFRYIAYPKTFPFSWQDFAAALVTSLFSLLTVTLASIAIAMYVARKIRKSS